VGALLPKERRQSHGGEFEAAAGGERGRAGSDPALAEGERGLRFAAELALTHRVLTAAWFSRDSHPLQGDEVSLGRGEEMRQRALIGALGLVLVGVILGATVFRTDIAQATGLDKAATNVIVKNTPAQAVPVHEQGTVPASQSGTWHVSVDGKPSVTSADQTALVDTYTGAPGGGGAFTEAVDADITGYRSVRVAANCFAGSDCANILVRVYSIAGSRSFLIDQFPMQNFLAETRVFDVLGTTLAVQLQNNNPGAVSNIGVAVFGRAN
jgi:hypothetical protein